MHQGELKERECDAGAGVSVVLTVLNDVAGTVQVIEGLLGQTRLPDEIIVVDGGSTDGTVEVLREFDTGEVPLRVLVREGANISQGRNHAIANAAHGLIACIDAGSLPDQRWLEFISRPFDDPEISVVGGWYRVQASTRMERVVGLLTMPGHANPIDPVRFNPSARSLAFRASAWERASGFPEWLYTAEDTLFDCKLRRNGEMFHFASDAIVRWRPRSGFAAVWKQFRNYARGEARIGRGKEVIAFWCKRYAAVAAMAGLGLLVGVWSGVMVAAAALVLLYLRPACAVCGESQKLWDFPMAVVMGHWINLSQLRGYSLGCRDRRRSPNIFVRKLQKYWGKRVVGSVPAWRVKSWKVPNTLIVSWHWAPVNRASAMVLSNLFGAAGSDTSGSFKVLTREMKSAVPVDPIAKPAIEACEIAWPLSEEGEGLNGWFASVRTGVSMLMRAWAIRRSWRFTRVLAVYPHRFSLLVGLVGSRVLGVNLVVYMHDLFTESYCTNCRIKRWFWQEVDRRALQSASTVVVPTKEFADVYRRRGITKVVVLPHCRPTDVEPVPAKSGGAELSLLYAGSVYQAHEDAVVALIRATDGLGAISLKFLSNPHKEIGTKCLGWQTRRQALAEMAKADVLVVALGHDTPYPEEVHGCFPSKLVDYFAVGRPILAVVPRGCFVDRLVRKSGCGLVVNTLSADQIKRAVDMLRLAEVRREMSKAAVALGERLDGRRWYGVLCRTLAFGIEESVVSSSIIVETQDRASKEPVPVSV